MVPGTAFADDFKFTSECVDGVWIGSITSIEGEILPNVTVRTMEKLTASNYEKKFVTDENGVVEIPFEDNTGNIWIQKGGFNDLKSKIEICSEGTSNNSLTKVLIKTNPDFSYEGEFWDHYCDSGTPVGVVVEGEVQSRGLIKLEVSYNGMSLSEATKTITPGNPKTLFCLTTWFAQDAHTITATNGNAVTNISWNPFEINSNQQVSEEDFRKLPAPEKEYPESMNVLGKVIRIFDDKICVEEYCKEGDTLPVHIAGNIGINSKGPIQLEITHLSKSIIATMLMSEAQNYVIGKINADNLGGGDFSADWRVKKTSFEGIYEIRGVADGKVVGEVGDSMMDIVNGMYNYAVIIVNNVTPLESTQVTKDTATIVFDIEYGQIGGTVNYEICAKKDLSNPAFEVLSDVDRQNVVTEIELKDGDCVEGKYTIMAKRPGSIVVPLGIAKSQDTDEIDALKEELAELRAMLEDKPKVPGWVKNNVQWWANGQVDDATFINGIEFMVKEKVINIPDLPPQASETAEQKIPDWIRNNAIWWSEGAISEDDFVNGIEFLVQNGIIQVQ